MYTTGLLAPTLVGLIGEATSLRVSFAGVAAATAVLVLAAGVLGGPERVPARGRDAAKAASDGGGHPVHDLGEQFR